MSSPSPWEVGGVQLRGHPWTISVLMPSRGQEADAVPGNTSVAITAVSYLWILSRMAHGYLFFFILLGLRMSVCCLYTRIIWLNIVFLSPIFLPSKFCSIVFWLFYCGKIWEQPDFSALPFLSGCLSNSCFIL